MKALLVLLLTTLAAATALAYGQTDLAGGVRDVVAHGSWPTEPTVLLLSGSALIGLGGIARRFMV
jgi:hypothetical protein